ncbi:DUF4145 domain-containing protein [Bacillus sonorensis]|uniref:DUF4145 domain-containing protein n=1 Tax=Bacillus sonorensis TaxID=119858 RepID=UPI002DB743D2|nr:DUF4145 domain-containing protein [Bacillus sonorensis]MEC1437386.1 DUF4145 domain-containing protein [Bacillus sonorensis]
MDNLKKFKTQKSNIIYFSEKTYCVPKKCPHCSNFISVLIVNQHTFPYSQNSNVDFLLHKCPECNSHFVTTHLRNNRENTNEFISSYPAFVKHQHPEIVENFSPRFVEIYNQAYIAEQMNHLTLAGTGYRIALEILVKDFAISENPNDEKKIEGLTLNNCIQNYFKDLESAAPAHVVRILGNDYAHYIKKFDQVAFNELKYYLDVFVINIEMKLKIKNPPVPVPAVDQ